MFNNLRKFLPGGVSHNELSLNSCFYLLSLTVALATSAINIARADVCFLPDSKGCEMVPYEEYGGTPTYPKDCFATKAEAMSARTSEMDSYYKNGDMWCIKSSCSGYNETSMLPGGWDCQNCNDANSLNYNKYKCDCYLKDVTPQIGYTIDLVRCEEKPNACPSNASTNCVPDECHECNSISSVNPVYSGGKECLIYSTVDAHCPEGYVPNEPAGGCYSTQDMVCGSGKCYKAVDAPDCSGAHKHVSKANGVCSCACDEGYTMNNGECVKENVCNNTKICDGSVGYYWDDGVCDCACAWEDVVQGSLVFTKSISSESYKYKLSAMFDQLNWLNDPKDQKVTIKTEFYDFVGKVGWGLGRTTPIITKSKTYSYDDMASITDEVVFFEETVNYVEDDYLTENNNNLFAGLVKEVDLTFEKSSYNNWEKKFIYKLVQEDITVVNGIETVAREPHYAVYDEDGQELYVCGDGITCPQTGVYVERGSSETGFTIEYIPNCGPMISFGIKGLKAPDFKLECAIGYTNIGKNTTPTCYNTNLPINHGTDGLQGWDIHNNMHMNGYTLPNGNTCAQCYCSYVFFNGAYGGRLNHTWKIEGKNSKYAMYFGSQNEAYDDTINISARVRYFNNNNTDISGSILEKTFETTLSDDWDDGSSTIEIDRRIGDTEGTVYNLYSMNMLDTQFTITSKHLPDYKVVLTYYTYKCNDYFYEERAKCGEDNSCIDGLLSGNCTRNYSRSYNQSTSQWTNNQYVHYWPGDWYGEVYYKGVKLAEGNLDWDTNTDTFGNASNNSTGFKDPGIGKSTDFAMSRFINDDFETFSAENTADTLSSYGLDSDMIVISNNIEGMPYVTTLGVPFPVLSMSNIDARYPASYLAEGEDPNKSYYYNITVPLGVCDGLILNINIQDSNWFSIKHYPLTEEKWRSNKKVQKYLND